MAAANSSRHSNFCLDACPRKLGSGGFGSVKSATCSDTGLRVACKVQPLVGERKQEVLRESELLESLCHPSIAAFKGARDDTVSRTHMLFMELADAGDLLDKIQAAGGRLPEAQAATVLQQLVSAVAYCHAKGLAHRDLKLENILFNAEGQLKLIDFGMASGPHPAGKQPRLTDMVGSHSYRPPEMISGRGYLGQSADMWNIGVSLFACVFGFFPVDSASRADWRFSKVSEVQRTGGSTVRTILKFYGREADVSEELVALLDSLLSIDPSARPTAQQVLEHSWVQRHTRTAIEKQTEKLVEAAAVCIQSVWRGRKPLQGRCAVDHCGEMAAALIQKMMLTHTDNITGASRTSAGAASAA